ncbi:MAG TPA: tetratricopeptide repeat protein [Anaerolineales bacterium]|jgi:tetratricopeptide (TPR) repeat protein|nr:tetratricopeptide repeat protein [Anaerolineales bacterium]
MLPQSLPDFDSLWDYNHPDLTETRFREILLQFPEEEPAFLELLTQVARAQGLQHKFNQAHQTLDQVERRLREAPSRAKVRYLLERGRVLNSSGEPEQARPLFEQALEMARALHEDFYAVDALHMLAIIASPDQSLALNLQAIEMAESSQQEKAQNWLGSLYNNMGWSYHDIGEYSAALGIFKKAEAWQRSKGRARETQIASWCVARTLRSLGRIEEALSRQMKLNEESAGEEDGYVSEEIGECLLVLNRLEEARPHFAKAYELLSQDVWLMEKEPERLGRLKEIGGS